VDGIFKKVVNCMLEEEMLRIPGLGGKSAMTSKPSREGVMKLQNWKGC
jgi:hypothetical protein